MANAIPIMAPEVITDVVTEGATIFMPPVEAAKVADVMVPVDMTATLAEAINAGQRASIMGNAIRVDH